MECSFHSWNLVFFVLVLRLWISVNISVAYIQPERCYHDAWTIRTCLTLYLNLIVRIYVLFFMISGKIWINRVSNCSEWFLFSPPLGFLRDLCEVLLYILLPPGDFQNKIMRYFVRVSTDSKSHPSSLV